MKSATLTLQDAVLKPGIANPIIDRLIFMRDQMEANNDAPLDINPTIIFMGGGMRGVYSCGVAVGLRDAGLDKVFKNKVGVSSGSFVAAASDAGQEDSVLDVFSNVLPNTNFINPLRLGNIIDLAMLREVVSNPPNSLDQSAIRQNKKTKLHIGMTEFKTGLAHYLQVDQMPENFNIIDALIASSCLPGMTKTIMEIGGVRYCDGLSGCSNPIGYAVNVLKSTDVLLVLNAPLSRRLKVSRAERYLNHLLLPDFPSEFVTAHNSRYERSAIKAKSAIPEGINVGVICPETNLFRQTSSNQKLIHLLADSAINQVDELFQKAA
ncbi:MAG: patatin-like phospholipase family protein [Candidatus Saccharimonadales bacterium]